MLETWPSILPKHLRKQPPRELISWPLATKSSSTSWQQSQQHAFRCNYWSSNLSFLRRQMSKIRIWIWTWTSLDDRSWAWSFFYLREFLPLAPGSKLLPSCLNAKDVELPSWTSGLPPSSAPGPRTTVFSSLPLLEKTLVVVFEVLTQVAWLVGDLKRQKYEADLFNQLQKPMMTKHYQLHEIKFKTYISSIYLGPKPPK